MKLGFGFDRNESRLLALLGGASFFNQYDKALLSLNLVQIQSDLGISEATLGAMGSVIKFGALPAFLVLLLADRLGRRRVLLFTIVGYALFTGATALAHTFVELVAAQFLSRMFMTAEWLLACVVIIEEFRPSNRGLGIGVLGALAAVGHGVAAIGFGAVDAVPYGWRGLYALGLLPLVLLSILRLQLPETRRFLASRIRAQTGGALGPLRTLVRERPVWLAAVCTVAFVWSFSNAAVDFFLPKYFQEVHGWEPQRFANTMIVGGALGLTGFLVAGWWSDRHGRKPTLLLFATLEPLAALALYTLLGPIAVVLFIGWLFCSVGNDVVGDTAAREIFPTTARATAAGACAVAHTLGGSIGLACESVLYASLGSHWPPVQLLAATGLLMPLVIWSAYPETSGRSLEEITPDSSATVQPVCVQSQLP